MPFGPGRPSKDEVRPIEGKIHPFIARWTHEEWCVLVAAGAREDKSIMEVLRGWCAIFRKRPPVLGVLQEDFADLLVDKLFERFKESGLLTDTDDDMDVFNDD